MKNKPKISVIVPMFNSEKTISTCIKSIQRQTLNEIEIILVNDGSTDETLNICNKYRENDHRISIISQDNKGLMEARKVGVEYAHADIIGFVDSDDWIEDDMYECLLGAFTYNNCDIVSSGIYRDFLDKEYTIEKTDNYREGIYCDLLTQIYPTMFWKDDVDDYGLYGTLVNKIFKKKILKKVYDDIDCRIFYGEDCLTTYAYMMLASSIFIYKKSFYHYNILSNSMCRTKNEKLLNNTYYLYNELKRIFSGYGELSYILLRQVRHYILEVENHTLDIMYDIKIFSGGIRRYNYPEVCNKRVILYGAGGSSVALYNYLVKEAKCILVAWLDKNPDGKESYCLYNIGKAEEIRYTDYDYIVIGVLDKGLSERIRNELKEIYYVDDNKILWRESQRLFF